MNQITTSQHHFLPWIINWARWSSSRPQSGHCASIEHRYQPERLTEAESQTRAFSGASMPIDVGDAQRIEDAICMLNNIRDRSLLADKYVHRHSDRRLMRDHSIRHRDLEQHIWRVLSEVDEHYQAVCDMYVRSSGMKVMRHQANDVPAYGRTTR